MIMELKDLGGWGGACKGNVSYSEDTECRVGGLSQSWARRGIVLDGLRGSFLDGEEKTLCLLLRGGLAIHAPFHPPLPLPPTRTPTGWGGAE